MVFVHNDSGCIALCLEVSSSKSSHSPDPLPRLGNVPNYENLVLLFGGMGDQRTHRSIWRRQILQHA